MAGTCQNIYNEKLKLTDMLVLSFRSKSGSPRLFPFFNIHSPYVIISLIQFLIIMKQFIFIINMKLQEITQALKFAFDLQRVADRIQSQHFLELKAKEKQKQALNLTYVLSEDGRPIIQLFGYHLAKKLGQRSFFEMGKTFLQILVPEKGFCHYCQLVWPDMGKYDRVLPILFRILKVGNVVPLRTLDLFVQICSKELNPFTAEIKQNVPANQIKKLRQRLAQQCEREDLINTGYAEKLFLEEIFKKQLKITIPEWPRQLYNPNNVNEINYHLLLSHQFLNAGQNIYNFIRSLFVKKIVRALKRVGQQKKGKTKIKKNKTGRPLKPGDKANKNEKLLQKYIETNKPKKSDEINRNQFMIKSLVEDIISSVIDIKYDQGDEGLPKATKTFKSVYVTEPEFPQIEYDDLGIQIKNIKFVGNNGLGLFVSGDRGFIMDNMKSTKKSEFQLNLSSIFKQSPIIQYEILDNILYLLKQNGLLYSWPIDGEKFLNQVQTSFIKPSSPPDSGGCKFLKIKDGIVVVNCTHNAYSRLQIFSLQLAYIGVVELIPHQYNLSHKLCIESQILLKNIRGLALDKTINSYDQYKVFIRNSNLTETFSLGSMLCSAFPSFNISKMNQYANWILSFRQNNKITFPAWVSGKLNSKDADLISYLLKLGYINEGSQEEMKKLLSSLVLSATENRKLDLISLYEDNSLQPIKSPFFSKQDFLAWIGPACLMTFELKQLTQSLEYRPDGKVDMSKLFYNQHYRRLTDAKYNRFIPERYKYLQVPPVCVRQFLPIPIHQTIVFTLCFPLTPCFYVANMLNGELLSSYNVSKVSSLPPLIRQCEKNGYIFMVANRSLSLWNSTSISNSKELAPIKNWIDLQSNQIVDLVVLYELSTVVTLTNDCIKIWDFDEMCKKKNFTNIFQLKPGYKAVEKQGSAIGQAKNFKKKILIREMALSLFYFISPNQSIVVGAVSLTKNRKYYIKSFTVNKFTIVINSEKEHYQIPTKLLRQLQSMALKRKNLPPVLKDRWLNQTEKLMQNRIASIFKDKLKSVSEVKVKSTLKPELQQKISILSHSLSTIFNRNMFKDNSESKRMENIFRIISIQNMANLEQILQPNFLSLYKLNDALGYDLDRMLQDCMSTKQKKSVNRALYVLSLIEKYSRTLVQMGTKLAKLISEDRIVLDESCVLSLFPKAMPLDSRIVSKAVKLLNSLPEPLTVVTRIIVCYLPSRYRFLIPRYIKQIYTGKESAELNEYISNHYENQPTIEQVTAKLKEGKKESIQQFLQEKNLFEYVNKQVIEMFPRAQNCNYQLIQALMCLKIINEDEAYHYCVRQSTHPGQRLSSKLGFASAGDEQYLDEINERIQDAITRKKINLTYPKVSYGYFKKQLYDGPNGQKFFFDFLQGDRSEQEVLSEKLQINLKMVKKKLSLRYRIDQWRWILGEKVKILKTFLNDFLERFPLDFRIVSVSDLKIALMSLIEDQNVYLDLIKRIAYSCTSSIEKQQEWRKTNGVNLQTQGMWVNINHLIRFMQDYNPLLLDLQSYSKQRKDYVIKLPAYSVINKLLGDFNLLSITKFRQILTLNLSPLSITDVQTILKKYFKYGNKKINLFELQELMPKDYSVFGRYLIDKYHRLDYQHRFTVINGTINSSQVVQLFNSKIIANYLFGDKEKGLPQFLPFDQIITSLKKHLLDPAATKMSSAFAMALQPQIIELIHYHLNKTTSIPVLLLSQLLHSVHNQQPIIICLLKFMTGESNSAQLINLNTLLTYIQGIKQKDFQTKYKSYQAKLREKTDNKNLIQLFLQQAEPQNFPFTEEDHPKSYILTHEHMHDLLEEQFQWFINFKPYATIHQFIDHVRNEERSEQELIKTIKLFTQNCVCRVGVGEIVNVIGENCNFPDFYYKIRSSFKIMAKLDTKSFSGLYNAIIKSSSKKACDAQGIRNLCQEHISINKKMEWICALYDRSRITNPLEQEELTLQIQLKTEKLKIIYDHANIETRQLSKQALKQSLNYHKYLAHKYLSNDPTKMKHIHECMKEKKVEQAKTLLEAYGVINTIHLDELIKYFGEEYHHNQKKFGEEPSIQQIRYLIDLIKANFPFLNNSITNEAINDQNQIQIASKIKENTAFHQFVTNGAGQYYCTYHSLLVHCQSLFQAKLTTHSQLLKTQTKIRDFLIHRDLTPAKLYDLLDLSTYQNILTYLPEIAMKGNESQKQKQELGIIITELARPERINVKYPINSHQFQNLLSDLSSKTRKDRKQYQSLYSDLDILGTGYVNLNDVPKFRGSYPGYINPYVHIPAYIDFLFQKDKGQQLSLPSKYLGPILDPPQDKQLRNEIKQKLLKYELPVRKWQKTKLIKVDICLAVMGQFGIGQNHQYQQFLKQKFTLQSNNLMDLSGVVDWLMESLIEERQDVTRKQLMDQRALKVQKLINQIQQKGGLYSFINIMKAQPKHVLEQFYANLLEISQGNKTQLLILGGVLGFEKMDHAIGSLKKIAQKYFSRVKKWDTFNNHFCRQIKNMAQMYYSLIFKFYSAHRESDMHRIYHNVSGNGQLTLLTLWRYIEDKGITGYSRADINELFSAIDINSDKRLSYLQFCQFWMACEQVFANLNIDQQEIVLKIDQINKEVKDVFLELCCVELDNHQDEVLNVGDLVKFMNIPNVEKVDYIVRAVNCASMSRGPTSGAFDTKIMMSKSKLKIMVDKMKLNQASDLQNLREDLIVMVTEPQIHSYAREGFNSQSIKKIILMKYPKLGYQIVQHLYDLCQLQPVALDELYKKCSAKEAQVDGKKQNRHKYMEQLVVSIEECYRRHPLRTRSYSHKQFGASIASSLLAEQVLGQVQSIAREVNQIYNFLNKIQMPTVPLYYQLDQFDNYFYPENDAKLTPYNPEQLQSYPYSVILDGFSHQFYTIQCLLFSKKPIKQGIGLAKGETVKYRQIQWLDTDIVCKSDNKVNLLLHANLYSDPEISLIPIHKTLSNRFKIQGAYDYKPQYRPIVYMTPIMINAENREQLMDRVMSLMKHLGDKLAYCYFKHGVTGLLINHRNVLVNCNNNSDIKFDNFLSGLALNVTAIKHKDQTVSYVEGIDPKYIVSESQICPPQAKLGTLSQAIDIYQIAHIAYKIFQSQLHPESTPAITRGKTVQSCEEETIWDWSSQLHEISAKVLKMHEENKMSEKEYNVWVLLYQCSEHDWFMRPRLHQFMQVVQNYFTIPGANVSNEIFGVMSSKEEVIQSLKANKIADALQLIQTILPSEWNLPQLIQLKNSIPISSPMNSNLLDYYNKVLQSYIKNENLSQDPETILLYLSNVVDYVLMIPVTSGGQCMIVNACYKNILNFGHIVRYLGWCDDNWKIQEYEINKKISKINMRDKLEALHKNSSYYHDIATLVQCRVTLSQSEPAKRSETSKKVAVSFIHSCLISNNINKIYAVFRSQILSNIYCSLSKQELQPYIISIFEIATSCFNPTLAINRFRAVDQIYRVMMVISNSIKLNDTKSNSSSKATTMRSKLSMSNKQIQNQSQANGDNGRDNQSVISMQDFVNNYYTLNGQECREIVLVEICRRHLCTLPVLTYLLNQVDVVKTANIILNLSYDQTSQKILRSPVVGGYVNKLKQAKMDNLLAKIKEATTLHTEYLSLGDLSTAPFEQQTYAELLKQHLKYYAWYCQLCRKSQGVFVNYQRNFYDHFQSLIAKSQRIYQTQISYVQNNEGSLEIIRLIIKIHRVMFDIYTKLPCHPDFTAGTLRFLMKALENIYQEDNIYAKSKINSQVMPDILHILRRFWVEETNVNCHDLVQISISNGFIQFYCRTIKKQHSLMQKYIQKNVQNIHMTDNYHPQAEFRLISFYLFIQNKKHQTQISQVLIANQLPSYIVDTMLHSNLPLDLRFYKANNDLVPFRYCHPLRAQSIAMIGYALSTNDCILKDDIASRLIPHLPAEIKNIDCNNFEALAQKMKWVESLWLLANITNCQNQRLKYEFVNLRLHSLLSSQIQKHPFLRRFFPEMTQTLRNSQSMISSLARSQIR